MPMCCEKKSCDLERLSRDQARVLWVVLAINAAMFVVELGAGFFSRSLSLTSDSLDMLGDAVVYGGSLYVLRLGMRAKAQVARVKAGIILVSGVAVLAASVYRAFFRETPDAATMGVIGGAALAANALCLLLLSRHRHDDVNMSSVWLCSRNDIIANGSVLAAAAMVRSTGSPWPDLAVGLGLAVLFTRSALQVFSASRGILAVS